MRHCRWCYKSGHNVKTCPTRKEQVSDYLNSDSPDDQKHGQWIIDRYDSPAGRRKRSCRYCGTTGHDIRKCPEFKERIDEKAANILSARKHVRDKMEATGFGIGSLMSYAAVGYERGIVLCLVSRIDWGSITDESISSAPQGLWLRAASLMVKDVTGGFDRFVRLPREIIETSGTMLRYASEERLEQELNRVRMHSSVSATSIPKDFFDLKVIEKIAKDSCKDRLLN